MSVLVGRPLNTIPVIRTKKKEANIELTFNIIVYEYIIKLIEMFIKAVGLPFTDQAQCQSDQNGL